MDASIIAQNQGKVIGMTSAEWNDNVQKSYNKWTMEEREKAQRLA